MTAARRNRGQPLVVFVALVAGWLGGRVAALDPVSLLTVGAPRTVATGSDQGASHKAHPVGEGGPLWLAGPQSFAQIDPALGGSEQRAQMPAGIDLTELVAVLLDTRRVTLAAHRGPARAALPQEEGRRLGRGRLGSGGGDGYYLAPGRMGFGEEDPMPPGYAPAPSGDALPGVKAAASSGAGQDIARDGRARPRRWSADAWALVRGKSASGLGAAPLPPTYGGSQAGAVLRYRLALKSALQPQLYMRTTSALGEVSETAAALGASARPVPGLPFDAALEGRLVNGIGGNRVQAAALVSTRLAPLLLPGDLRGEAYGQAGYVTGRYATAFGDGQARLDKGVVRVGKVEARLGGGVWAGAQKGAWRVDAGPSAMITMPLNKKMFGRLALDWRQRVAGDAEPGSGPAVTLSAGF
ncbi:hypothetical protein [Novosphingobium sp. BW1]|uniref:hypothetical protein n=1 Tax=Novosphingobium sp. BW1 TaxID=2592621 RepID=UPI0011DE89AD|nr:hypothetical protein [Novosphingobium sp. BW1]TYC81600.1 hypothetical protein FMM79_19405 [Novosphingobium sp. BW1]